MPKTIRQPARIMGKLSYHGNNVNTKSAVTFPSIFDFFVGQAYSLSERGFGNRFIEGSHFNAFPFVLAIC